jgi:hypothetical protein
MRTPRLIAALLLICLPAVTVLAENSPDWKEVKNRDGIQVYTRGTSDSPILIARGLCQIDAGAEAILKVLDDNASHSRWVPFLLESRRLKTLSRTQRLEYNLFSAPWPASDRDFVYRAEAVPGENGAVLFSMRSQSSPLMPEQEDTVRGTLLESTFHLTPLTPSRTQVELRFHADPNGWIPDWITNIIQRHWPYLVLKGLRAEVMASQGQGTPK